MTDQNSSSRRKVSFPPAVNAHTKVLILGSMPGVESLRLQQYYAHPRNHFWPLMTDLLQIDPLASYEERVAGMMALGIGIWDVLASCVREASLDANIKEGVPNSFSQFFQQYPQIEAVLFNGGKAYDLFRRQVGFQQYGQIRFWKMPSTSPANTMSYEQKRQQWRLLWVLKDHPAAI